MNDLIDNELTKRIALRAISFFASTEYFILIYKIEDQSSSILLSGIFLIGMFYVLSVRFSQIDLKFIDLSKKESNVKNITKLKFKLILLHLSVQ